MPQLPQVPARLVDLLDGIKNEFATLSAETSHLLLSKHDAEAKRVQAHMAELSQVRKIIQDLNIAHRQMRERYEGEIARLRQRLDAQEPRPPLFAQISQSDEPADRPGLAVPSQSVPAAQTPNHAVPQVLGLLQQPNVGPIQPLPSFAQSQAVNQTTANIAPRPPAGLATPPLPRVSGAILPGPPVPGFVPEDYGYGQNLGSSNSYVDAGKVVKTARLASLDLETLPAKFKKDADGYRVVYNPEHEPRLDVELLRTLQHSSVVCCVRFSTDGRFLATGCNRSAQIYDVQTGDLLYRFQDPTVDESVDLYIRSVCFSPDGKLLATGAEDHKVRVWDIEKREIRHVFAGHEQDIYSLAYASSGKFIVSGSGDRKVKLWDMEAAQCSKEFVIDDGVTAVALSPDDRFVAVGSLDKSVRVWDVETRELVENLNGADGHEDSVYSVSYRPEGRELVSGSLDRTLKVWGLSYTGQKHEGRVRRTVKGHNDYVLSVAVTPDSHWILSGSKDRTVQMWDAKTGEVQLMLMAHVNSVISVAQCPVGNLFASGGGDFSAKIWKYTEL